MNNNVYKSKVSKLINKAKKKNLVKNYDQFCNTDDAKEENLAEDEVKYYTSKDKGEK